MKQTMTTQEVAIQYYALANQGKWDEIQDEFFAADVVNKEPDHVTALGATVLTRGLEAVKAKSKARREMIETIHSGSCSEPMVAGSFFTVAMNRDVSFKGKPRMQLEEIIVFQVKDGKIISEEFFYS
jgi:hypothetical protein